MDNMEYSLLLIIIACMTIPTIVSASQSYPYDTHRNNLNRNIREASTLANGRVVIDCKDANYGIFLSGIVYNNKVYFVCLTQVYEYDPITKGQRVIIKTIGSLNSSGLLLNNKLYFLSFDNKVYEYDFATNQQRIINTSCAYAFRCGLVLNNKIYYGSTYGTFYEYDLATDKQKSVFRSEFSFSFWTYGVLLLNKIYVSAASKHMYEYDSQTNTTKIVIKASAYFYGGGIVLNNKIYFGSYDNQVFEYDPETKEQKVVIKANNNILADGVGYNNKLYFGSHDGNIFEYDPKTDKQDIIITGKKRIHITGGVVLNNKLYYMTGGCVYQYNFLSKTIKLLIKTGSERDVFGLKLNNAVYFSSKDGKVYEFVDDSNSSFDKNTELEECLNYRNTRTSQIISLTKRVETLEKLILKPSSNNNNHCISNKTIDLNELSKFLNNVLSENLKQLGKNIKNDEYTNMLKLVNENNVLNKIKQAGTNIENIKIDKNNIETFIGELSKNMFHISSSLDELGDAARAYADIPESSQTAKLEGIIFKKLEEIILNLKNNEDDLFKKNIKVLGSSITEVGERVFSKESQPLGNKIKEIGKDLSQTNLGDEFILEYVGNKIDIFGSSLQELGEIIKNGKMTMKETGLVLKNIGYIIKKFITANFCETIYNSKSLEIENLDRKIPLKISDSKIRDLEKKLLNTNEELDNLKFDITEAIRFIKLHYT